MKRLQRVFFCMIMICFLSQMLLTSSLAATTVGTTNVPITNDYAGLQITAKNSVGDYGEYTFDSSTGVLEFGAQGYMTWSGWIPTGVESTTTTITVHNGQSYSIDITLAYSGSYTPTAKGLPAKNSDDSYTIPADSSFTLSITSGSTAGDMGMHSTTVTIGIVTNSVTVTFSSAIGGSMAQTSVETDDDGYFTYTPVPASDYVFWGFRKNDGGYIETNASKTSITTATKSTYQIVGATTLTPVFIKSDSATFYSCADSAYYPYLDEALAVAKNASSNKKISVYASGVAYARESSATSFTVDSGVTLLVPYGSNDSGSTSATSDDYIPIKNAYRTLTVLSGDTLVVKGTLIVNGVQGQYRYISGSDRTGCMYMGTIQGDYGCIDLRGKISVENGGSLYARGLIIEKDDTTGEEINNGTGEIVAKQGSNVYQMVELVDWRGGTSSKAVYETVFPLNVFHVQNIQVKTTYQYGSALSASYYVYASRMSKTGTISIISSTADSLFTLSQGNVVFRYDRVSKRSDGSEIFAKTTVEVNGGVNINKIAITVSAGLLGNYEMTTAGKEIPLSGAFDIEIASGSKLTLTENVKVLPGARLTVNDGGEVVLDGGKLYLYDVGDFSNSYSYNTYRRMPISARLGAYSHSRLSGGGQTDPNHSSVLCHSNVLVTEKTDGQLFVEGTLTIKNGGGVYSSTDSTTDSTVQYSSDSSQILTGNANTGKIVVESAASGLVTIKEVINADETTTSENFSFAIGTMYNGSSTFVTTFAVGTYYTDGTAWYTHRVDYYHENTLWDTDYYVGSMPSEETAKQKAFPSCDTGNVLTYYAHSWTKEDSGLSYVLQFDTACTETLLVFSDSGKTTQDAISTKYRLDDYLWLNAVGYLNGAFNSGSLSVTTYDANGNVVATNAYGAIGDSLNEDGVQIAVVGTTVYLVKAIPAKEIPDSITFSISYNDGTKTYTSVKFTVSLEAYSATLTGNDKTLADKLLSYGDAAKDYADSNTTLENGHTVSGNTVGDGFKLSQTGDPNPWNGVTLETTAANVYFDEALRLGISYQLSGIPDGYTIKQIGLLVGELSDEENAELTLENRNMAYLLFNEIDNGTEFGGATITNGDLIGMDPENGPWDTADQLIKDPSGELVPVISADGKSGTIIFDLKAQEYKTMFSLRPAIVLQNNESSEYVCVYGRQIGYGLGAYINGVYATDSEGNPLSTEYNYLLEQLWALAGVTSSTTGG